MKPSPELSRVASLRETARLIVDANGQIRDANAAAHRLLGYENGTMVGLSLAWLMPPSRHTLLGQLSSALHGAGQVRLESVLMHDDGSLVPVVLTTQPRISVRGHELAVTLEPDTEVTVVAPPASKTFPLPANGHTPLGAADLERSPPKPFPLSTQGQAPATLRPAALSPLPHLPKRSTQPPPVPECARARHPSKQPVPKGLPPSGVRPNAPPTSPARELLVKEPSASGVRERAAPRRAAQQPLPKGFADKTVRPCDVAEQLGACMELLRWLEMQLQEGKEQSVRDRALSRVMLREASSLLELCHAELSRSASGSPPQD